MDSEDQADPDATVASPGSTPENDGEATRVASPPGGGPPPIPETRVLPRTRSVSSPDSRSDDGARTELESDRAEAADDPGVAEADPDAATRLETAAPPPAVRPPSLPAPPRPPARPSPPAAPAPPRAAALEKSSAPRRPAKPSRSESMIGKSVLGRYRIEERLGSGGFGSVYRAIDELKRSGGEDDSIAIKVVDAAALGDGMGALVQEVSRSHRVTHPNIVRVFDIHVDEGFAFITMELLRGMPLSQRIASGALGADSSGSFLPIAEVDAVARSISRALAHCHAQNLVHADVKPANIFLCSDGTVKLLDLGIAQITGSRGKLWGYTQDYASPEQMSGDLPDPRDDIFSLGCVLYECLTGPSSSPRSPSGTKRSSADRFDFSKLPRRYRKTLALAVAPSREARLASVQTLWRRIDPAIRRRNAILAVASATALVASLFAYQNVRRTTVAEMVNEADQAAAETAFQNAIALATDRPDEARAALLEAIETNPFHEEAADVLAGWVRGASYVDALAYNDVWIDYQKALKAAPNSEPLQDLAHEQIDRILDAEVRTLPRSQVLSEFRTPLCVLPESGYRSEELVRLRADLAIRC